MITLRIVSRAAASSCSARPAFSAPRVARSLATTPFRAPSAGIRLCAVNGVSGLGLGSQFGAASWSQNASYMKAGGAAPSALGSTTSASSLSTSSSSSSSTTSSSGAGSSGVEAATGTDDSCESNSEHGLSITHGFSPTFDSAVAEYDRAIRQFKGQSLLAEAAMTRNFARSGKRIMTPDAMPPTPPDQKLLRSVLYAVTNAAEAEGFKNLLVTHLNDVNGNWTPADSVLVWEVLARLPEQSETEDGKRAEDVLFEMLCDQNKYALCIQNADQIHVLMGRYSRRAHEKFWVEKNNDQHIAHLDKLYQCFAVLLYNHVAPNSRTYSYLIEAGVNGGTEEGWKRSLTTYYELVSLGLPIEASAGVAIVKGFVERRMLAEGSAILRKADSWSKKSDKTTHMIAELMEQVLG
ncbi:hypothetical protein BJ742DRAFT_793868 [Cladochytrium replicatum]|nr:hypothetical protein BJ742DRAFT_793868 [Cladochytrium replicatum]